MSVSCDSNFCSWSSRLSPAEQTLSYMITIIPFVVIVIKIIAIIVIPRVSSSVLSSGDLFKYNHLTNALISLEGSVGNFDAANLNKQVTNALNFDLLSSLNEEKLVRSGTVIVIFLNLLVSSALPALLIVK